MPPASVRGQLPDLMKALDYIIEIEVGSDDAAGGKRTFTVIGGIMRFYSGHFESSLGPEPLENYARIIELPNEDPDVFESFMSWVRNQRYVEGTLLPNADMSFDYLAKLWIFGEAHQIPMFQNNVLDIVLQKMVDEETFFSSEAIHRIYEHTVQTSELRQLVADSLYGLYTWIFEEGSVPKNLVHLSQFDPKDVVLAVRKLNNADNLKQKIKLAFSGFLEPSVRCYWHVHEDGVVCPAAGGLAMEGNQPSSASDTRE